MRTLFTGQRERDKERGKEREREGKRKKEREREEEKEKERKRQKERGRERLSEMEKHSCRCALSVPHSLCQSVCVIIILMFIKRYVLQKSVSNFSPNIL